MFDLSGLLLPQALMKMSTLEGVNIPHVAGAPLGNSNLAVQSISVTTHYYATGEVMGSIPNGANRIFSNWLHPYSCTVALGFIQSLK
jgi:hypothetical protein